MIEIRKANERGHFNHEWLDTYHTFSFDRYHDPAFMRFRSLRVINEDRVQAGKGFPTHPHRDMEIITYIQDGELAHEDSMGNRSIIRKGDVQRMTAGSGILHSEYNNSPTNTVHFLQIWIIPNQKGLKPEYEQKTFSETEKRGRLLLVVSPDGHDGSLKINQDILLYSGIPEKEHPLEIKLASERFGWLQVVQGSVQINDLKLTQGDGAGISNESELALSCTKSPEILFFDLP